MSTQETETQRRHRINDECRARQAAYDAEHRRIREEAARREQFALAATAWELERVERDRRR